MKIFITGGSGFVGGHLVPQLRARGDTIVALARRQLSPAELASLGDITPVQCSLETGAGLREALADVEVIYHLAGVLGAPKEEDYFKVNEGGTRCLVEAAQAAAPNLKRFVYVSTQAAVGPSEPGKPLKEDAEPRPLTPYGRSKLAGEKVVTQSSLPWTIVRPPAVYGPGDKAFLPVFKSARFGLAPVFGSGSQQISMIYVEDLARAIIAAGTHEGALRQIFHVAHATTALSGEVGPAAAAALGRKAVVIPVPTFIAAPVVIGMGWFAQLTGGKSILNKEKMHEFTAPAWLFDVSKSERLMGWKAEVPLAEGMRRTAEWYRAQKLL
jgi:2-alkyl-3-oxoalkanoate reductase